MPVHLLSDVDVVAISIVDKGANRKQFYLKKQEREEVTLPSPHRLLKAEGDAWSIAYCVVAEPGWRENPGQGSERPDLDDEWASPDEIRLAAHKFMKNGALVNRMHETLEPYGTVVENFVAQSDFAVGMEVIKAGSWVVGIEPSEEGRSKIETGEFTGISIQGSGVRKLVEKDHGHRGDSKKCPSCGGTVSVDRATCQNCSYSFSKYAPSQPITVDTIEEVSVVWKAGSPGTLTHEPTVPPGGPGLFRMKGKQLPAYIQHVFNDLVQSGHPHDGRTYALAIGIVKNWAAGHDGHGHAISKDVQAKAAAAIAEWNKLKAEAKARSVKKSNLGTLRSKMPEDHESKGLLRSIAKALGIKDEEVEEIEIKEKEVVADDATTERLSKIEGTVNKSAQQVEALANRIADIATALAARKDEEKDEEKDVKKQQEDLSKQLDGVESALGTIREAVEKLATGASSQSETHQEVTKNDHPLAGVLLD